MLQRAVKDHQAGLAKQLFPSSSPTDSPKHSSNKHPQSLQQSRVAFPLDQSSGNRSRSSGGQLGDDARVALPSTHVSHTLKRKSSHLTTAIHTNDPFQEPIHPRLGSQSTLDVNKEIKKPRPSIEPLTDPVYFDENDFDDDLDLDEEDPTRKGLVSYPSLPSQVAVPKVVRHQSTASRTSEQPRSRTQASVDSGYDSHQTTSFTSTSKPNQFTKFEYPQNKSRQSAVEPPSEDTAPPAKRRTLPWAPEQDKVGRAKNTIKDIFTPLPKNRSGSAYPWNTTASVVKEQQRNLKQANKNLIKANEGTRQSLQQAANHRKKQSVAKILLSHEQKHVLDLVVQQQNSVFFTGSAGTGKSVLLRQIIHELRKKYIKEPGRVAVTASTGLAACNIGGVTLHSFAGIGLGQGTVEDQVKKIKKNQKAKTRWLATKVLVVDEISMIDGDLFDKLEQIARRVRNNGRPFGGIQLIITGDFFQLPPVPDKNKAAKFAFDADTWNTSIEHTIALHHVFRQKDPTFAEMLNEMRESRLTPKSINAFKSLQRELHFDDDVSATELFPRRREVDLANSDRMHRLVGEEMIFEARDSGSITDKKYRDQLLSNCMAPEVITLKKGAQVMLIKNMDDTLVNGSLGKVIGFMNEATWDTYQVNEDAFHLSRPHDRDETDEGNLSLTERKSRQKVSESINNGTQCWPVVRFSIADGTTRDMLCHRESWKVELPNGEVQASRSQVPLMLAWALSIHKAQGQTLERVKVDLGNVFENGQAYVALSRATSMDGLQVLRFDPKKVFAHDKVRQFYSNLARVEAQQDGTTAGGRGKSNKPGLSAGDYEEDFAGRGYEEDEEAFRAYG